MRKGTRAWGKVLGHASVCKNVQGSVRPHESMGGNVNMCERVQVCARGCKDKKRCARVCECM